MRTISHILCPVDLSEVSSHTIDHAALLARWYGSRLTLLHVFSPVVVPIPDYAMAGVPGMQMPASGEQIATARAELAESAAAAHAGYAELRVETGQPAKRILESAESLPADLIVIGTHGLSGFAHLVLGSVTEKVLRQSPVPVLTVPPRPRITSELPFRRILCPIDFSDSSLAALEFAFSLAHEGDADLTILHVFDWPDEPLTTRPIAIPEFRMALEHDTRAKLEHLVPEFQGGRCRPATRMTHGKAYREILGIATEDRADLIVMGVHGRNALDLMLFGSTTNQVVRRATCPVLTLRR